MKHIKQFKLKQVYNDKYTNNYLLFEFDDNTEFCIQIKPSFELSSKQYALFNSLVREVSNNGK